jgi:hypothetical protein
VPKDVKITKTGDAATKAAQQKAAAVQNPATGTPPNPPNVDPQSVTWDPSSRVSLASANVALDQASDTLKAWFDQYGNVSTEAQRASVASQMSVVINKRQQILADINKLNQGG